MSKRLWFLSAFVSLAFVHVFALYKIPVEVYLRHSDVFATPLADIINTSLLIGAMSLLLVVSACFFVLLRMRKLAAPLLMALTVTFWIIYSLFGQVDPIIDENFQRVDLERYRAVIEALIFLVMAALLLRYRRYLHATGLVLLSLATVYYVGATTRLMAGNQNPATAVSNTDALYALSANNNLLLLQMGGFQSGYFSELLAREPDLATTLDGFIYFPDTLGAASRPGPVVNAAIHAGYQYDRFIPMNNVQADYLDGGSVFSKLAMAGADVRVLQQNQPCPYLVKCINNSEIRRDTSQVHLSETLHVIDSALLIMSPEPLKNFVYRGGRWLVGAFAAGGALEGPARSVFDDHAFLEMFADKLHTGEAGSSVRYFQLGNTRAPGILSESCKVKSGPPADKRQYLAAQARCGLLDLQRILASLKGSGLYDNTAIVVMAETGPVAYGDNDNGDDADSLIGSANPLLLIKPLESSGPLRTDDYPAQLTDLPRTLCGLTGLCRWPGGNDLLVTAADHSTPRQFIAYSNSQYNRNLGLISGAGQYQLDGPVNREESWWRVIDNSTVDITGKLEFSSLDDSRIFGHGWGVVEIDPTAGSKRWVSANTAHLSLALEPGSDYLLEFTVYPAPGSDGQSMEMHVNGHWVGRHSTFAGINTLTYTIPGEYILPGNDSIELDFSKLAEPAGLDERKLAMSFFQLQICRVLPDYGLERLNAVSAP